MLANPAFQRNLVLLHTVNYNAFCVSREFFGKYIRPNGRACPPDRHPQSAAGGSK
jgi:hypothetical protein